MRYLGLILLAGALTAQPRQERIAKAVAALEPAIVAQRRDFHANPELSNREERTAQVIAAKLRALQFDEVKTGVGKHGIVALLKGGKPGPVVAWRADMDALPVFSTSTAEYRPKKGGVHHACGHDAHMAIALGAAEVLAGMRDQIPGTIKFIFQPAEEGPPKGEVGGAALMIKEGALDNPRPSAIFGLHVWTNYPVGTVGYSVGPALASADTFSLTIKGKQVHASAPHMGIDPITTAAQCITQLQTIRSRRIDPGESMVLSIGSIHGGNRHNIIPDTVTMEGTVRTFSEEVREGVRTMMRKILTGCTAAADASFTLTFDGASYPVTVNPAGLTAESLPEMRRVAGESNIIERKPITGAEDFSYFQREIPGFFWFLGARNEAKGIVAAHHTPDFDLDEALLPLGVKLAANQLLDYLERHQ